jgi:hypothetical protein
MDWLRKYPRAAALLQGDGEELLYDADGDASLLHQAGYAYVVADIEQEYARAMAVNSHATARAIESQHAFEREVTQHQDPYVRARLGVLVFHARTPWQRQERE